MKIGLIVLAILVAIIYFGLKALLRGIGRGV